MVKRGDVAIAVFSGDYGKPRLGVVVQTDLVNRTPQPWPVDGISQPVAHKPAASGRPW